MCAAFQVRGGIQYAESALRATLAERGFESVVAITWRAAPAAVRFTEHRLAQCLVPRLCRLHRDNGVLRRPGRAARLLQAAAHRGDVRRSGVVACHRALIADVLRVRGIDVIHILDMEHTVLHPFTSPARIVEGRLTYVLDGSAKVDDYFGTLTF
jgi:hypothetical protein